MGAEAERILALPDHPPIYESQGDITAQVVVFNNWIKAAGDDEFRAAFPNGWRSKINNAIERADDEMYVQFGIDFRVSSIVQWDTFPDDPDRGCGELLDELIAEVGTGSNDTVAGYSAQLESGAGCTWGPTTRYILVLRQDPDETYEKGNRWKVTQHEYSHLYEAPDRYPDLWMVHPDDVMEDPYGHFDYWCTIVQFNDHGIIYAHRDKYE